MTNNMKLRELIDRHQLTRPTISGWLMVNLSTVDRWLVPPLKGRKRNPTYRTMPDRQFEMLRMKIEQYETLPTL